MTAIKEAIFCKMVLDAWFSKLEKTSHLFDTLTDDVLMKEVAPGHNRGIYLFGHLTAVHDYMFPLLGFGEPLYPELFEVFVTQPDKAIAEIPATAFVRTAWKAVNEKIKTTFTTVTAEEWFQRHNSVSETDFAKELHRNKLNVVISRTNHLEYHLGQLVFLKDKQA